MSLGIFPTVDYEFFTIEKHSKEDCYDSCVLNVNFQMDLTTETHKRNVFTIWMLLGNVGGLYGILCIFGSFIVSLFNIFIGSGLERFIAGKIFLFEKQTQQLLSQLDATPMTILKAKIASNRPAIFQLCGRMVCCIKKKRIRQL